MASLPGGLRRLHISLRSARSVSLAVLFTIGNPGWSQDNQVRTARELVQIRQEHDRTVWSPEVEAQFHEDTFVKLWDGLIHQSDKFAVLRGFEFDQLILPTAASSRQLDHGIELKTPSGSKRTIDRDAFLRLLNKYEQMEYKIIETEWHHSAFDPAAGDTPARSTVAVLMHVTHDPSQRRMVVRGDLKIQWQPSSKEQKSKVPEIIDASGLKIYQRQGQPAFQQQMVQTYQCDGSGKTAPTTIHPVIVRDLNQDGLPEVVIGGFNQVYWNRGSWKFEKATLCDFPVRHVNAGVIADFDGDGIDDFVAAGKSEYIQFIKGDLGGRFPFIGRPVRSVGKLRVPTSIAAGDIDGDGDLDLFVGQQKPGYSNGDIPTPYYDATDSFPSFLLLNDGQGNFRDVTGVSGIGRKAKRRNFSSTFVDLDDDGDLDLLLTSDFSGTDLFLNDGQGNFTDATETMRPKGYAFGMSHSFGDYNLDGHLDFITIGMSSTTARRLEKLNLGRQEFPEYNQARMKMGYGNRLFLRDEEGFSQAPFNNSCARTGWSWGSTTLDFDRDGDQDIYIVNGQTSGRTTKDYCTRFWCHDVYYKRGERPDEAIRELFNGLAPLFAGNHISWNGYEHNALLMNLDGDAFVNVGFLMDVSFEFDSRTAISADLDADGRVDLVVEHKDVRDDQRHLYFARNVWPEDNHWIGVQLKTNRVQSPLGAKVVVTLADGRKLLQHCLAGHSVWAQHANWVHFGIGKQDAVKEVEIRWPGGIVSKLSDPAIDKYHIVEPSVN